MQSEVYATYHVNDPDVLYNKGDQWQIPDNVALSGPGQMSAYYVIMRLPKAKREEFLLIRPFTPNQRPNMIAWLGALSDGADYGKSVAFQFAKGASVYGPSQVEAAINQDPTISAQRSLWGQQGSRVIMGNLLVIPIEDSLLYVQPLYLEGEQTQLPQMKRVIVFYQASATATSAGKQTVVYATDPGGGPDRGLRCGAGGHTADRWRPERRYAGRRHAGQPGRHDGSQRPCPAADPAGQPAVRGRPEGAAERRLGRVRAPDRGAAADPQPAAAA